MPNPFTLLDERPMTRNMKDLHITLLQTNLYWENAVENRKLFGSLIDSIEGPTDLLLLPETFNTGFSINPARCAETMEGETIMFLQMKAMELNAVIMGSLLIEENSRFFNRLLVFYPDGRRDQYNKRHLFRLSREFENITPGSEKVIVTWKGWKILPLVCYDLRFPVWSKNRLIDHQYEYDVLVYLANWPKSRSGIWKSLLVARAIENQCFVAGVNRIGKDGDGTSHAGDTMVVEPSGNLAASVLEEKEEVLQVALSMEKLQEFRKTYPFAADWDRFTIHP